MWKQDENAGSHGHDADTNTDSQPTSKTDFLPIFLTNRITHSLGDRCRDSQRDHESQACYIDGNLVRCQCDYPKLTHHQGNYCEHADFCPETESTWNADSQNFPPIAPNGPVKSTQKANSCSFLTKLQIEQRSYQNYPMCDGGRPSSSHSTHLWETKIAEDQGVVANNVDT